MNSNKNKSLQLGMSNGKATHLLRKQIIFFLVKKCSMNLCFRCGQEITDIKDLSIDHKTDWLYSENPGGLFFDMDNIAFSHLKCNTASSKNKQKRIIGKSGFKGVTFSKIHKKYKALIDMDAVGRINLGYFKTAQEGALAYDKAIIKLLGENAITNKSLGLI